jgi:hypothetical protein
MFRHHPTFDPAHLNVQFSPLVVIVVSMTLHVVTDTYYPFPGARTARDGMAVGYMNTPTFGSLNFLFLTILSSVLRSTKNNNMGKG